MWRGIRGSEEESEGNCSDASSSENAGNCDVTSTGGLRVGRRSTSGSGSCLGRGRWRRGRLSGRGSSSRGCSGHCSIDLGLDGGIEGPSHASKAV